MSIDKKKCIPIYYFELNHIALPTDKLQSTEELGQEQNILAMHSRSSHSSYPKDFDVITYIVNSVE